MGCVITVMDESAMGASQRDLASLTAAGKAPTAAALLGECPWCVPRARMGSSATACWSCPSALAAMLALERAWLLPLHEMHFSKSSFTAREKADEMPN